MVAKYKKVGARREAAALLAPGYYATVYTCFPYFSYAYVYACAYAYVKV